jgi:hypothetical protein
VGQAIAAALGAGLAASGAAAPALDLSGEWELEVGFAAERSRHGLTLQQKGGALTGTHRTLSLAGALTGTIAGDRVELLSQHPFEGTNLSYAFTGRLDGGAMAGEVLLGTFGDSAPGPLNMREFGSATWSARRRP